MSGTETTIGSFVRSRYTKEYNVSKLGRTTCFMSAVGNVGTLNITFIGLPIPLPGSTLVSLPAGQVHSHKRVEVDVRIYSNGLRLLLGNGALCLRGERNDGAKKNAQYRGYLASIHVLSRYSDRFQRQHAHAGVRVEQCVSADLTRAMQIRQKSQ